MVLVMDMTALQDKLASDERGHDCRIATIIGDHAPSSEPARAATRHRGQELPSRGWVNLRRLSQNTLYPSRSHLALRCPALPCLALPCPALRCPALPCLALPFLAPALSCSALPCLSLPEEKPPNEAFFCLGHNVGKPGLQFSSF